MLKYEIMKVFGKLLAMVFGIWFRWRMPGEVDRTDIGMMARVLEPLLRAAHWEVFENGDVAYLYPLNREFGGK